MPSAPLSDARRAYEAPPIHDISTDVGNAPQFAAVLPLRKGATNGPEYDGQKKVMLKGQMVAGGDTATVFAPPYHPYTELLLSSVPEMRRDWLDGVLEKRG